MIDLDSLIRGRVDEAESRVALVGATTAVQRPFDRALARAASPNLYPLPRRPDALERRLRRQISKLSAEAPGNAWDAAMASAGS